MAENNSSAPLLPCPFCGASARGYEIEPHQHSAALLALVPNMPKEHQGSYVIEGDCQCGSGLIGNNLAEVTARWNARAPQAVAAQAAPAAVGPVLDSDWRFRMLDGTAIERDDMGCGEHPALPVLEEGMKSKQFFDALGIELQCVMADDQMDMDAYEAMVEVPDYNAWTPGAPDGEGWKQVAIFDTEDGPACWWIREAPPSPRIRHPRNTPAAVAEALAHDEREEFEAFMRSDTSGFSLEREGETYKEFEVATYWHFWMARAALAATPARPATEDSSAGDLAEETRDDEGISRGDWLAQAERLYLAVGDTQDEARMCASYLYDEQDWDGFGGDDPIHAALDDVEGRGLKAGAQAELVALQMCSELKPRTDSEKAAYTAGVADGRMYAERDANTAPQAQPADALTQAARDVLAERRRQVEVEGFSFARDDSYTDGELAQAAACYAASSQSRDISYMAHLWPWPNHSWKPGTTRGDLVKAGALILAELERINRARAAMAAAQEGGTTADQGLPLLQDGQENGYGTCTIDAAMPPAREGGKAAKEA